MRKREYVCLVGLIYFVGSVAASLGSASLIMSINPMHNNTKIHKCEKETVYFLYSWGIIGIILGGIVISLAGLQCFLFIKNIVREMSFVWMLNISIGIALGFFFAFGAFVSGFLLFKHCTYNLSYYTYIICPIFGISTGLLLAILLGSLVYLCRPSHENIENI
jgi:hypothetical protein